ISALSHHLKGPTLLLVGALTISMFGFIDECIQGVLPNRVFELKDVGMNIVGGLLGVLLARFVLLTKI
ncbi:MAG: VanZ family protein, partial [Nitrospira sp.]|nr:VanZ family protein [Nitrospira sp.]